jgi:hypothetical protein
MEPHKCVKGVGSHTGKSLPSIPEEPNRQAPSLPAHVLAQRNSTQCDLVLKKLAVELALNAKASINQQDEATQSGSLA